MSTQSFDKNGDRTATTNLNKVTKEKVMSYEEKSVGSTAFFKCEACPYMALAEDDIKFHLFTVHPDLAKSNGLADNIQILCPGCISVFDAEETLRTHLRNHHKMGIKDVKIMVKSLIQIALKDAKLKKEDKCNEPPPPAPIRQEIPNLKIPQVIEIVPDTVNATNESLPTGVAFISVDELHKMSTPNFDPKVDPKDIIQEASINIVYTNEASTQYVNVSNVTTSNSCNVIQVSSVTPDLISSIKPRTSVLDNVSLSPQTINDLDAVTHVTPHLPKHGRPRIRSETSSKDKILKESEIEKKLGKLCSTRNCHTRLKDSEKLEYHRKSHQNGKLQCLECSKVWHSTEALHTHLWKIHAIDMELPTCDICGFKTYKRNRLFNIHMKCHKKARPYPCSICSKAFKNANQLSKHKLIHNDEANKVQCSVCQREFNNERQLKIHTNEVHEKLRPHKCSECDYTAARKEELKLHIRSHTGDKPYACNECEYRSADHNAMRRHKKIHSKDSLYKCKYCPYSAIQSTLFASHMISKHPNVNSTDVHRCPYCPFKSVNKDKYVLHLTNHSDKEEIQLLIKMEKGMNSNKPSWTIPSDKLKNTLEIDTKLPSEQTIDANPKSVNTIPIELYDCDSFTDRQLSFSENLPQDYSKNYCTNVVNESPQTDFNTQVTDLSKDDNNSDCLISESSNDTLIARHQYTTQHTLQNISYDNSQSNLHGFLNNTTSIDQNLLQTNNVSPSPAPNHSVISSGISNNIMSNFPIRLPPVPQISFRNNVTLKPIDKIPLPMTKVIGPIIKPTQILPVPSSSNSPIHIINEPEGVPRKKPKISVKSNLILKGPDQVNMFHSQQKMAFKRLEDNERFGLGGPVTFNNLISTQFMQLPPEPAMNESPNDMIAYPQDSATTPVGSDEITDNSQIFTFNQQINVNSMTMLPPTQKIQTNDPSYIKLEATIKQNTQSPSLESMCNANILNNQPMNGDYKASPPLEDIHKNMNVIKNEVKADTFYTMALNNTTTNPPIIDQYLIDNIIGEQYPGHIDLSSTLVLPEVGDDQQNDVIEIDDNSDDNKLPPRFDMNFPIESLYLMHSDFHFLESDIQSNNIPNDIPNDLNRMVTEVPIITQKENLNTTDPTINDFPNFIQGKKDPMMNTSVRPSTNKINVKNIELMKN